MKYVALIMAFIAGTAHARTPHFQLCEQFSEVAKMAAIERGQGMTEAQAQDALERNAALRYGHHFEAYKALTHDVYTQPDLMKATPDDVLRASAVSCQEFNDAERAHMHD